MNWVVLTQGDRPRELAAALHSVQAQDLPSPAEAHVIVNGTASVDPENFAMSTSASNLGVPGGRDFGVSRTTAEIVGFLDDDATLATDASRLVLDAFAADPGLGAVSLRLVDEQGGTARRHVPRRGNAGAGETGDVATFLGGACAVRRVAYQEVGGYFTDLFYGHEELELSWRLVNAGWAIRYLADVEVFHPKAEISRHADGWRLTGRNRVWIARRTLPWAVALIHVSAWLVIGVYRAPRGCRRSYLSGWCSGWIGDVGRSPISWSAVRRLGRLGRLPIY